MSIYESATYFLDVDNWITLSKVAVEEGGPTGVVDCGEIVASFDLTPDNTYLNTDVLNTGIVDFNRVQSTANSAWTLIATVQAAEYSTSSET